MYLTTTATGQQRGNTKFINLLVDALNEHHRLLKYILVVLEKDLITCIKNQNNYNNCNSVVIGACLHHIIRQIDCFINRRKQDLTTKKLGATLNEEFPQVIWVRMLKRPSYLTSNPQSTFSFHGKFNSILEECLFDGREDRHHIMSIEVRLDEFN